MSETNVPAQASDEPMDYTAQLRAAFETVCEGWTLPPGARKTLEAALWAPATPRATADVERNGFVLVPIEPTDAMMDAMEACSTDWPRTTWKQAWAAAIAATKGAKP